jgi:hypothetical protein
MFGRADFDRNANECLRLAQAAQDVGERLTLLRMAESWRRLAGHAEHIASLIEPDTAAVSAPRESSSTQPSQRAGPLQPPCAHEPGKSPA